MLFVLESVPKRRARAGQGNRRQGEDKGVGVGLLREEEDGE